MGFELPDPEKKSGKYNNRKMSFDAECRKLFLESCKKFGLEVEEEPIYGGKKYLEKQEYIIEKLNADIKDLYDTIDTWQEIGEQLQAENERLTQENKNLELKIEDVEGLLKEVSEVAYDKACDTLVDEITDKVREEDLAEIEDHKKWLMSPERKAPKNLRDYAFQQMESLQKKLGKFRDRIISRVRKAFKLPEMKDKFIEEIMEETRPSTLALLDKYKAEIKERDANTIHLPKKNRGEISR